jgi:hypothetical protein
MRVSTQDLYLGAYLLSKGGYLEEVKVNTRGRGGRPSVTFIFSGPEVERLSREFQTGRANTNIASFKAAMIHLKDIMFNTLRASGE